MSVAQSAQIVTPRLFGEVTINTLKDCIAPVGSSTLVTNTNWTSANFGMGVLCYVPRRVRVKRVGWFNGTAVAGNIDAGVYTCDMSGNSDRLLFSSGAVAQAGTSAWQYVDITDFDLGPGIFIVAISASSGSARIAYVSTSGVRSHCGGVMDGSSLHTLPATNTWGHSINARHPLISLVLDERVL